MNLPSSVSKQQPRGVLVQPPHRLNPLHRGFLGALAQRRRQQGVDAGPGRRLLRALGACRFVQHQIGLTSKWPVIPLHFESQTLKVKEFARIDHGLAMNLYMPLLDQSGADPAGTKALTEQNVFQAHGFKSWNFHGA
jgi:hypothetical protein